MGILYLNQSKCEIASMLEQVRGANDEIACVTEHNSTRTSDDVLVERKTIINM